MNAKEQQRAMVLNRVERGDLTGQEGAALVGLSLRQVRRLLAAYRREGVAALAQLPAVQAAKERQAKHAGKAGQARLPG